MHITEVSLNKHPSQRGHMLSWLVGGETAKDCIWTDWMWRWWAMSRADTISFCTTLFTVWRPCFKRHCNSKTLWFTTWLKRQLCCRWHTLQWTSQKVCFLEWSPCLFRCSCGLGDRHVGRFWYQLITSCVINGKQAADYFSGQLQLFQ